jgi:hypothetical protein
MPFHPPTQFGKSIDLTTQIYRLKESEQVPENVYQNFIRYHSSLIHKLKSAQFNLDSFKNKFTDTKIEDTASSDFMFEVNMFIDGFFYNAGSTLDILARVVLTSFGQVLPRYIKFKTAYEILNEQKPGDPILPLLVQDWFDQFSNYRNALTHEIILAPDCHIEIAYTGNIPLPDEAPIDPPYKIVIPLPDNPRADRAERTTEEHPDGLKYLEEHFALILQTANLIYGNISDRAEQNGQLPL